MPKAFDDDIKLKLEEIHGFIAKEIQT